MLPGVSRFAATVFAGRLLGLSMRRSLQWSWFMFAPLMAMAGLIHGVGRFVFADQQWFVFEPLFFAGCVLATALSYTLFAAVLRLFQARRSWVLGLYMLLPIALVLFFSVKGH